MNIELRWMTSGDSATIQAASYLFDDDVQRDWAEKFLHQGNHHLCIAYVDDEPVGFVSGVEITHPDKGTEMLLYELGVDDDFRRHGIGRSLAGRAARLRPVARLHGHVGADRRRQRTGDRDVPLDVPRRGRADAHPVVGPDDRGVIASATRARRSCRRCSR